MRSSSSDNNRADGRGGDGRRGFGDLVRDFTGRMPLVGRVTGRPRQQRQANRTWDERENAAPDEGPGGDGFHDGAPVANGRPISARDSSQRKGKRPRLRDRNFSIKMISVLALLSVIVGFCCTQSTLTVVDAASAALDAKAQANAIEAILKGGSFTDTGHLTELQTRLVALNGDLVRLQAAIPGPVAGTSAGVNLDRTLTMALTLVQAGRYGMDAALILIPHLKGALTDIGGASATPTVSGTAGATPAPTATAGPSPTATAAATTTTGNAASGGLTMADVTRAQQDVAIAGTLAQQALAERQNIDEAQLSKIGLGSIVTLLHKIDGFAPKLPTYLGYAHNIMGALPDLLGITKPAHFLLFNVDSDELRSTGGFMGNYAVLTVVNGRLIGGVHLSDTATFDCNGPQINCPPSQIPAQYAWMNADTEHFGMRDSNLSPDFPTSAKLIIQMYQQEMQKYHPTADASVDGVIMMTPEIIKDILKLSGSLTMPGFKDPTDPTKTLVVTPSNLQDAIHFFHIQNRNLGNGGTSAQKAIDGLLGSALLHKIGTMSAAEQGVLMKAIVAGIGAKDLQIYISDPNVESVLSQLHMDSTIPMPQGLDGLMVTDVNVGATYFNQDLQESVADTITFDAQGDAIHDMTITYKLPKVAHLYTPIYIDSTPQHNFVTYYTGIMRVLVPDGSQAIGGTILPDGTQSAVQVDECTIPSTFYYTGCPPINADAAGYVVWAAHINGMQVDKDTLIFHMKWKTPNVLKTVNNTTQYNLHLYKQAGSHITYDIIIKPPSKSQIAQPLTSLFKTPAKATPGTAAEFTSPLLDKDELLTLTFTGS
jgi:hypothetical protein